MQRFAGAANWNLEQSYETGARKVKRQKKEKEPKRLPIKTAKGIVHAQLDEDSTEDEAGSEDEEEKDGKGDMEGDKGEGDDVVEKMKELEMKPKIPEKQRVLEAKEELAKIAFAIQEDPEENVSN